MKIPLVGRCHKHHNTHRRGFSNCFCWAKRKVANLHYKMLTACGYGSARVYLVVISKKRLNKRDANFKMWLSSLWYKNRRLVGAHIAYRTTARRFT